MRIAGIDNFETLTYTIRKEWQQYEWGLERWLYERNKSVQHIYIEYYESEEKTTHNLDVNKIHNANSNDRQCIHIKSFQIYCLKIYSLYTPYGTCWRHTPLLRVTRLIIHLIHQMFEDGSDWYSFVPLLHCLQITGTLNELQFFKIALRAKIHPETFSDIDVGIEKW